MAQVTVDKQGLKTVQRRAMLVLMTFVAVVFAKVLLARYVIVGIGTPVGMALDLCFIFVAFATADLFFADMRFRALIIVDIVISALVLAIAMYVAYYQMLPTREALGALGQAGDVSSSIATLLNPAYLILFIDVPVFVLLVFRAHRKGVDPVTGRRSGAAPVSGLRTPYVYQGRAVYVVAVVAAISFGVVVQQVRFGDLADGKAVAAERGVMAYLVADILGEKGASSEVAYAAPERVQDRISSLAGTTTPEVAPGFSAGQAAGKNVVVIQVEALQVAAIGTEVGGVEVTPNLNDLISRSWYFPNHFTGVGRGTTSDAEFLSNTSLYPPTQGAASLMYAKRDLPSLPRLLRDRDYEAYTFHTNSAEFWNRTQLYPALGFSRYYDREYFGTADKIAMGASDRVLFDKTLDQLRATSSQATPFYAQVITMSSHFPFIEVPVERRKVPMIAPYKGTIEGDYLTEIHYVDSEIGRFVEGLERSGLLEDTVVVIYGDHFGLPIPRDGEEERALQALLGGEYTDLERMNTPLIIHLPGQEQGHTLTHPVGQIDIMPSIADALGVDLGDTPHFGKSAFRTGPRLFSAGGLLPIGSYFDESVLYVPGSDFASGTVYDVATRQKVGISRASEDKYDATKSLLELSSSYVDTLPERADYNPDAKAIVPTGE